MMFRHILTMTLLRTDGITMIFIFETFKISCYFYGRYKWNYSIVFLMHAYDILMMLILYLIEYMMEKQGKSTFQLLR
jgi:hypothetical protein